MPQRTRADRNRIREVYEQTGNGRETARLLDLHENTVYSVLRVLRGLCGRCGQPLALGKKHCADCLLQLKIDMREKRAARKRAGICAQCDQRIVQPSRMHCAEHRLAHIEALARYEARKKRGAPNLGIPRTTDREHSLRRKYGPAGPAVWKRDGGCCVLCRISYLEKAIHLHHIDKSTGPTTEDNLVSLCMRCHGIVHTITEHPDRARILAWIERTYPHD